MYRSGFETVETPRTHFDFKEVLRYDGVEEGVKGLIKLSENESWLRFRIAEGILEIQHTDVGIQQFELEN